jgi:hypothetical protein
MKARSRKQHRADLWVKLLWEKVVLTPVWRPVPSSAPSLPEGCVYTIMNGSAYFKSFDMNSTADTTGLDLYRIGF